MVSRTVIIAIFLTLLSTMLSFVFGQIDPKAKPFLGSINEAQNITPGATTRTLDYILCSTSHEDNKGKTCTRTVVDFVNRRMMVEAHSDTDKSENFQLIYKNGQATITDAFSEKPTVFPKDQAAIVKRSFEYIAEVAKTGGTLPDKVLSATYDGTVRYGKVIGGTQVTVSVLARSFMLGNTSPKKTTMSFIFSKEKQILGFVTEIPPRNLLYVLDNPADPIPMRRFISGEMYWLENGKPKLSSSQQITRYRLNPKLNSSLFDEQ